MPDTPFKIIRPHRKDEFEHSWEITSHIGAQGKHPFPSMNLYVEHTQASDGNNSTHNGEYIILRCPRFNLFDPFKFGDVQVNCLAAASVHVTEVPMVYDA